MNRGARLRTPVRTYLLTKAMQRRWHDLRQRHREPQLSQTGRQAFVNDSIGKKGGVHFIPDIHHFGSYTLATPIFWKYLPGHMSAYTIISLPMTIVALLNGDISRRLLHVPSPHTKHVVSSSAFRVQDVHSLYPASDRRMPSNAYRFLGLPASMKLLCTSIMASVF